MKYCSKCGKELLDEAVICPNCGCPIEDKTIKEFIDENKRTTAKKNLYTGLLLNIFSVVIPIVLIIMLSVGTDETSNTSNSHSGGVTITTETDTSPRDVGIAMMGGIAIFALGLAVYFVKEKRIKSILAYVYLIASISDFVFFFFAWMTYIIATCFMGAIGLIPGILQIRAGIKFVAGCKDYEA